MSSEYEPGQPYDPANPIGSPEVPYSSPTAPPYGYHPGYQAYPPNYSAQPEYAAYYGNPQWAPPAPGAYWAPPKSSKRRWTYVAGAAAVAAAVVIGIAAIGDHTTSGSPVASGGGVYTNPNNGNAGNGNNQFPFGGTNNGNTGNGNSTTGTGTASTKQQVGVVDIDTVLGYQNAEAAGTGLIMDSSGDVLTNNHVIDGATKITVTIVSTGKTYAATVVGTVPTKDIAVIHLTNASGLTIANFGDSSTVKIGDSVTGVGNAGGQGGTPSAAAGTVTALNQTITASDESGSSSEKLTGVIATNAPIQSGDSGGPLYNSSNEVIGIDTAASQQRNAGFAIPINSALALAAEIEKGVQTSSVHIGLPGFLGVTVVNASGGVGLNSVIPGGPAEAAGLAGGDVITAINGTTVANATDLKNAVSAHKPGQKISVSYTDASGNSHTTNVTLEAGPAD